ncbi:MbtH family NRPS accessory protein [Streptomyces sp. NPDC001795]|uniref:MbtH family protein n=1 Tax=unclassified Streptomyces TaxID=2593676 RepID=UPI00331F8ECA
MADTGNGRTQDLFLVVRNAEEQYSIWPEGREVPDGWTAIGDPRPKEECLAHIGEVWTDMRPASLRRSMAQDSAR